LKGSLITSFVYLASTQKLEQCIAELNQKPFKSRESKNGKANLLTSQQQCIILMTRNFEHRGQAMQYKDGGGVEEFIRAAKAEHL